MDLAPALHDYPAVRHYLYSLKHHGAKYGIDRMRLFSERLGHPERSFPVIHIAGTNGKGSVAAMIESVLRRSGYSTGLYTSPHLVRQGERVQVNRRILSEDKIVELTRELQPIAADLGRRDSDDHPSFFEFMTAMAFLQFKHHAVDVAIVEVGLGGRLDATNVVEPDVCVITSIGHDHMEILGDTIEKIAAEKAGIIKPRKPVILGPLPPEAEVVIRDIAAGRNCVVATVDEVFGQDAKKYPQTSLEGSYQRANAATAILALRAVADRFPVSDENMMRGLMEVNWPGRWQHVHVAERDIILDASHNPEGAECLEENLARLVAATGRRPEIMVGVLGASRAKWIVPIAARYAKALHFVVVPHQPRACTPDELAAAVPRDFTGPIHRTSVAERFPAEGVCHIGGPGESIVVTGSIYLLGDVMDRLLNPVPYSQGVLQD